MEVSRDGIGEEGRCFRVIKDKMRQPQNFHIVFLSIVFCFWFSMYIYIPTFSIYLDVLDMGYYASGIIMGSYGIMQIIIRFPLGIAADKYKISSKLLVAFGFAVSFISALLLALTNDFMPIFFGRFLAGVTAAMWVVLTIWYSSSFEESRSLKAMGILQSMTVASQLISMAISSWIADVLGFTSLFWIGGIFALIGLFLVLSLSSADTVEAEDKTGEGKQGKSIVKHVVKNRKLWSLSLLSLLSHAVLFTTIFGFSSVYFNELNDHAAAILLLVIAFMVPHVLAPVVLALKKRSFTNPFLIMFICFVIGALSLLLMGGTNNWAVYCFLHTILGLSLGFIFPVLLDQVSKTNHKAGSKTAMGFYQSLYSIGIVAGPIAAGYIAREVDLRGVFIMSSILLFIGGMISVAESAAYQKSRKYKREHQVST